MKYRVQYSFKILDKNSKNYGLLQEGETIFDTFVEAVEHSRRISRGGYTSFQVLGKPIVESVNG